MRKRRAEGAAWIDPIKEAERKARWYHGQGGKAKLVEATRRRRQAERDQGLAAMVRKLQEPQ